MRPDPNRWFGRINVLTDLAVPSLATADHSARAHR